jgi:hypothetical protein
VRDTKLEKQNHDATPKHQGNLKRFLRDLHRGHERDEKDKERAKSEVARLSGLVSGNGGPSTSSRSSISRGPTPSAPKPQATPSQRKQQLAQLAELGVSIPDEFRGDMALAGEWQVTEERIINPTQGEKNPDAVALGIRKRSAPGDEDEMMDAEIKRKRYGSSYRTYPTSGDDGDLDALLSNPIGKTKLPAPQEIKAEADSDQKPVKMESTETKPVKDEPDIIAIKREPSEETKPLSVHDKVEDAHIKADPDGSVPGFVFKKRKAKNIRHK